MLLRLENAYESMAANMRHLERLANNLANANTVGYRQDRMFTEVLNERIDDEGAPRSTRRMTQWADVQPGSLERTGNPFDVAIEGDGFFVLSEAGAPGPLYTRAGQFMLDEDGALRTSNGRIVEGINGPIEIPPDTGEIEIRRNGDVMADGRVLDTLRVVRFTDPSKLERVDGAAFRAGGQVPQDVENPGILQGHLESSNVNVIDAMTELIANSRLFESQQRVLRTIDLKLQRVTRELARF